jgi:DNA-binding XRE family transcriptional regulator
MNKEEFSRARISLGRTQSRVAELLSTSLKAVQSYEQGWRSIPAHVESQMLFLLSLKKRKTIRKACWTIKKCSADIRRNCPAWELKAGEFCWSINGTLCQGKAQPDWNEKMKICRSCEIMISLLEKD